MLICSLLWGKPRVNATAILILKAKDLSPLARFVETVRRSNWQLFLMRMFQLRVSFKLPGPVPKPLHGSFLPSWDFQDFQEENLEPSSVT